MHILISNDDGLSARGIKALAARMEQLGKITVVAPDRNCSGASNSLTLDAPIRIHEERAGVHRVAGTPTDCVHIALTGLLEKDPDLVVSGINHGANLGDDVIYSGTVAAAMEGRFLGLPAIALSLVCDERPRHFESGAEAGARLVAQLLAQPLPRRYDPQRQHPGSALVGNSGLRGHPSGSPASGRAVHCGQRPARPAHVLDWSGRRRRRCRPRHGL